MALFHTYGYINQVVIKTLDTYYTREQIGVRGGTGGDPIYENHRVVSKKWKWVGMDEASARACIRHTREKYDRTLTLFYNSSGYRQSSTYEVRPVSIVSNHDEGGMWSVSVDLCEDQMQITVGTVDVETLWDNNNDYDEAPISGTFIAILNSYVQAAAEAANNVAVFEYEVLANGYDRTSTNFDIETAASASAATWRSVKSSATINPKDIRISSSSLDGYVRIKWKGIPSSAVPNPTHEYTEGVTIYSAYLNGTWCLNYSADFADFDPSKVQVIRYEYGSTIADLINPTNITAGATITDSTITTTDATADNFAFRVMYDHTYSPLYYSDYDYTRDFAEESADLSVNSVCLQSVANDDRTCTYVVSAYSVQYGDDLTIKYSVDGRSWYTAQCTPVAVGSGWEYGFVVNRGTQWGDKQIYAKAFAPIPVPGTEPPETELKQVSNAFKLPWSQTANLVNWGAYFAGNAVEPSNPVRIVYSRYFKQAHLSAVLELYRKTDSGEWQFVTSGYLDDEHGYLEDPAVTMGHLDHTYKYKFHHVNDDTWSDEITLPVYQGEA